MLYTLGCSFTYGEELPDPSTQSWPALLANKLGYTLDNQGQPGRGNSYIVRTAMEQVPQLKPKLVIVAWTSCGRMEFYSNTDNAEFDIWAGCSRVWPKRYPEREELVKNITVHHSNDQHQYRNWLRSVILLQDFFKLRNINYRFVSAFDNQNLNRLYMKKNQVYVDLIDTDKFIGWPFDGMSEWQGDCPRGPNGHPLELGHQRIADAIFSAL